VGRGHGFHGRRAELAAVLAAVRHTAAATRGRQGHLVVIRGAPGSGRSALLAAAGRTLLIDLADRTCAAQPHRAAHWYAAALRHVPPHRQEHANVLAFLLRLLVQNGQYDLLGDVLADEARVAATDPAVQDDLEAAAMLTAFHTGHPVKVAHEPIPGDPAENHLTRLFARTGCRSRVELAAASIDGRLKELGP
jgi:hypothetical protein